MTYDVGTKVLRYIKHDSNTLDTEEDDWQQGIPLIVPHSILINIPKSFFNTSEFFFFCSVDDGGDLIGDVIWWELDVVQKDFYANIQNQISYGLPYYPRDKAHPAIASSLYHSVAMLWLLSLHRQHTYP